MNKLFSGTSPLNGAGPLVSIVAVNPNIRLDIRYATKNNFTHEVVYKKAVAYVLKAVADKLDAVQRELEKQGLGLKVFDAYRPMQAQEKFWQVLPDERYVLNPKNGGGRHTRGTAVDVTLVDLKTGHELEMPTPFDEFSERAHGDYTTGLSAAAIRNRALLRDVMATHGFLAESAEWWHFDLDGWQQYPVLSIDFDTLV